MNKVGIGCLIVLVVVILLFLCFVSVVPHAWTLFVR